MEPQGFWLVLEFLVILERQKFSIFFAIFDSDASPWKYFKVLLFINRKVSSIVVEFKHYCCFVEIWILTEEKYSLVAFNFIRLESENTCYFIDQFRGGITKKIRKAGTMQHPIYCTENNDYFLEEIFKC